MTPQLALAEGRLTDAIDLQSAVVAARPDDPPARLFLFELLVVAGRLVESRTALYAIQSPDPAWPESKRWHRQLVRAARRRSLGRKPALLGPVPRHARLRWRAIRSLIHGDPTGALNGIDRADRAVPHLVGHVDGREFDGLRDLDDRFASVLEVLVQGQFVWLPFEQVRRLTILAAERILDSAYRPAQVRLTDGREFEVVLPLVYPGSDAAEEFLLGLGTDCVPPDGGPLRCVGAKTLMVGEEELPLGDLRELDLKVVS